MKKFEVRRVPADWVHPVDEDNQYIPLVDGLSYSGRVKLWQDGLTNWNPTNRFYKEGVAYELHAGECPNIEEHLPNWPGTERTHLLMYDVRVNDGTPVSPPFVRPEDLCRWLVENQTEFEDYLRDYDDWMEIATSDDIEGDHWYDCTILTRAAMNALFMKDQGKAEDLMRHLCALQSYNLSLFE
jgi:hypothetical protein